MLGDRGQVRRPLSRGYAQSSGFESSELEFRRKHCWPVLVCEAAADKDVTPVLFEQT